MIYCPVCYYDTTQEKINDLAGEVMGYVIKCTNPNCNFRITTERGSKRNK
jgi:hypothetical protein